MQQRQYINREYKTLFGVCVCGEGDGGLGEEGKEDSKCALFDHSARAFSALFDHSARA